MTPHEQLKLMGEHDRAWCALARIHDELLKCLRRERPPTMRQVEEMFLWARDGIPPVEEGAS